MSERTPNARRNRAISATESATAAASGARYVGETAVSLVLDVDEKQGSTQGVADNSPSGGTTGQGRDAAGAATVCATADRKTESPLAPALADAGWALQQVGELLAADCRAARRALVAGDRALAAERLEAVLARLTDVGEERARACAAVGTTGEVVRG